MGRKKMTDEERKAFGEKMKKARAAAKAKREKVIQPKQETEIVQPDVTELLKRIQELESAGFRQSQISGGKVVGTTVKHSINPKDYPDPCERLAKEKRLAQFAFEYNYDLEWKVTTSAYQTKDGVNIKEPKFNLQLNKIVYDDDGNPTSKRYIVRKMVMHEDPDAALVVAADNGMEVTDDKAFLDEMRYLQMRDWLFGLFYPTKGDETRKLNEMVVGGQLVQVFEVNSEESETIPFDKLKNKLK